MVASSANRQHLHQQLAAVFRERGYEGATLAQLAQATGLSKASLYHHFPGGKAEMAAVFLRDAVTQLQQQAFAHLQSKQPPAVQLQQFIDGFAGYVAASNGHCLVAVLAQGSAAEDHGAVIAQQYRDWLGLLAAQFEALGHKPKRAQRRAADLLASLYGLMLTARLLNDEEHFKRGVKRLKRGLHAEA